jgi:surface antigen
MKVTQILTAAYILVNLINCVPVFAASKSMSATNKINPISSVKIASTSNIGNAQKNFLGTGKSQILWRNTKDGTSVIWEVNQNGSFKHTVLQNKNLQSEWTVEGMKKKSTLLKEKAILKAETSSVSLASCYSVGYDCTRNGYNGVDSWSFHLSSSWRGNFKHNCTAYASWQATQLGASHPGVNLGNANTWAINAASRGIPVTSNPVVGSIAVREIGTYGHVAVVEAIDGDSIWISEDNYDENNGGWTSVRKVNKSYFQKYILFGRLGR